MYRDIMRDSSAGNGISSTIIINDRAGFLAN